MTLLTEQRRLRAESTHGGSRPGQRKVPCEFYPYEPLRFLQR